VNSFREVRGEAAVFVLVQEHIPGTSLEAWVGSGWGTETEIRALGAQILRILGYIHSLHPPLIHRDLNPKNLIRREDGQVFLVDFGGVQDAIRLESGASATVIGTPGYVPMEQYMGRATVRSDYYAFAATLLFLLSHRSPADFPLEELKIDLSALNGLSRDLTMILANWLEPDETRRTLRPENALASLTLVWLGFVAVWDAIVIGMRAPTVFVLFSIPFWAMGLFLLRKVFYGLFGQVTLEFSASRGFRWVREFLGKKEIAAPLADVGECISRTAYLVNNQPQNVLELEVGAKTIKFGEFLSDREKQWLAALTE